jgi:hypothetical protein
MAWQPDLGIAKPKRLLMLGSRTCPNAQVEELLHCMFLMKSLRPIWTILKVFPHR